MASRRVSEEEPKKSRRPPGTTPEARENQMIALAVDAAEKQLRDGTASSQVITHYLKLASPRETLERERLAKENLLVDAKIESMATQGELKELYVEAMAAMRRYSGIEAAEGSD